MQGQDYIAATVKLEKSRAAEKHSQEVGMLSFALEADHGGELENSSLSGYCVIAKHVKTMFLNIISRNT